MECGISNSYLKQGYVGNFGFKDGVETMRGRMIDNMDNEMEYIIVYKENDWFLRWLIYFELKLKN